MKKKEIKKEVKKVKKEERKIRLAELTIPIRAFCNLRLNIDRDAFENDKDYIVYTLRIQDQIKAIIEQNYDYDKPKDKPTYTEKKVYKPNKKGCKGECNYKLTIAKGNKTLYKCINCNYIDWSRYKVYIDKG